MYRLGVGGDLIVAVDGKPVTAHDDLQRALNRKRAGDKMELTIYRGGKTQKINVKLGSAPESFLNARAVTSGGLSQWP